MTAAPGSGRNSDADSRSSSPSEAERENQAPARPYILVVEDNRGDVFLIREALHTAHVEAELQIVNDGEKAIQLFADLDSDPSAPCPSLIILDINLPKKQGREVVGYMRRTQRCGNARVLVVTSSDSERDREEMGSLGISGYFRKPSEYDSFMKLGELVKGLLHE